MGTKIRLIREGDTGVSTYGHLLIGDVKFCYTLEDSTVNGFGKGCGIPKGVYALEYSQSPRFGRKMLRLVGVPGRTGILIHVGNTAKDCIGCILVGNTRSNKDFIGSSAVAVKNLERYLVPKLDAGEACYISIE